VLRNIPSSICSNNLMCFFNINLCSSDLSSISWLSEMMCWNLKVYHWPFVQSVHQNPCCLPHQL
jgi:hypothetical protein